MTLLAIILRQDINLCKKIWPTKTMSRAILFVWELRLHTHSGDNSWQSENGVYRASLQLILRSKCTCVLSKRAEVWSKLTAYQLNTALSPTPQCSLCCRRFYVVRRRVVCFSMRWSFVDKVHWMKYHNYNHESPWSLLDWRHSGRMFLFLAFRCTLTRKRHHKEKQWLTTSLMYGVTNRRCWLA